MSDANLLPTRADFTGENHALTYEAAARRFQHIPPDYVRDLLRSRLPSGAPTLFAKGRYATGLRKRPRAPCLEAVKARWRPTAKNVLTLVEQQTCTDVPMPFERATFALLPKSYRKLKRLVGHHLPVFTAVFDHSSRLLLTGSDDQLVKIWSTETGYLQHTLRGHDSDITEIVKHPTRPIIVSASGDTTLRVWDVKTGAALYVLDGGNKEVNAVQFSPCPDRPYLVSGGADGSVRLWNADHFAAGCIRIPIPGRTPNSRYIAAMSSDTRHAAGSSAAVATSRTAPPSPVADNASRAVHSGPLQLPASSRTHPAPAAAVSAGTAPASRGRGAESVEPRQPAEQAAARYPTANSVAANSMVSGAHPTYGVLSVGFNAGATRLAVGGEDGYVYLYAVERPQRSDSPFPQIRHLTTLRGHSDHIIQVLFSRSGDSIVTACRDGTARIWNRTKARLPAGKKGRHSVAGMGKWSSMILDCRSQIQADARSVLSGAASGSACGSIVPRLRRSIFPVSVDAAMWSLTDKYVFTASSDAKIRMWDSETGKLARVLEAHEREVYVMDCHPTDQRILLSAGYDGKCILWDIETGRQLRSFSVSDEPDDPLDQSASFGSHKRPSITDGQFSADGLSFALSDTSGAITIFGVESVEATALAPEEQFFSKDCTPFRRDAQNRAIDEDTGLLLHLVPKGRLCDKDLRPHPPELQPNPPLPKPAKDRVNAEENSGDVTEKRAQSPNAVENKNRDALMLRAKQFRENQEKEERRLLRQAREARRRMIIEKEKAALERDVMPTALQLRDFEVKDLDCDDSDESFDVGMVSGSSSSASDASSEASSEEEDEIRPNRDGRSSRRSRRRVVSTSEEEDEIRQNQLSQARECSGTRQPFARFVRRGIENPRPISLRRHRRASNFSDHLGESEVDAGEESPGYEIGSQDNDSENSATSSEIGKRHASCGSVEQGRGNRAREGSDPSAIKVLNGTEIGASGLGAKLSPSVLASTSQVPTLRLAGASVSDGRLRMKINIQGRFSIGPPSERLQSNTRNGNSVPQPDAESQPQLNDTAMTEGKVVIANSVGSCDGRGEASEAGAFMGLYAPRNPSFTSERIERKNTTNVVERSSKAVEDHQGDTASCIRPRRSLDELEDGSALASMQPSQARQHSSAAKSRMKSGMKSEFVNTMNDVSNVLKTDGNEKSLLSDSPARLTRKRLRSRNRKGVSNDGDVGTVTPDVDIDELAERELQLLEAQGGRKHGRKRRRHSTPEHSDGEQTSDEGIGERRAKKSERDEATDLPRKTMRKRGGRGSALIAKDKSGDGESAIERRLSASAWLRSSSNRYTYVPQLGDDVMYFPAGHATAINISRAAGFDPLAGHAAHKKSGKEMLDGTSFSNDAMPIRCQIVDVSYEFPLLSLSQKPRSMSSKAKAAHGVHDQDPKTAKTISVLTLRLVSGLRRRTDQSDRFVISYYPVDAPEYVVLTSRVEAALSRSWKASDRFRILFLNERRAWQYYTGTIRSVKPSMRSVMWNTVEVEYDNESEREKATCEFVSPWELEACDMLQEGNETPLQYFHSFRSSTVEPGLFPIIARDFETIREVESNWRVQLSWLDSVDALATLPGYCSKVPCPMDFNTVLVRLCTGYYRHFCSFIHDFNLLKSNAIRFHGAESEMGRLCVNIYSRLAETAERTRAHYVASMMPLSYNAGLSQGAPIGHGGSRTIRPRPTQSDMTAQVPTQVPTQMGTGRQFPVPLTPRQSGTGFAMPSQYVHESMGLLGQGMTPSTQQRQWAGTRNYLNNGQGHLMYGGQSLGVALPPALPGMSQIGAVTRGSRTSRVATRAQHGMRQNNSGQARRGNMGPITRGNLASPPPLGIGSVPHSAGMFAHNLSTPFAAPHIGQVGQQQPGQVTMVANSSQPNDGSRGGARRIAPSSALSNPRGIMKPSSYAGAGQGPPNGRIGENGNFGNSRAHMTNALVSPTQEGGVGLLGGALSMTQPSPQGVIARQQNRGVSTVGDGGTHSWGRSMEGAGGIFPLQASTSESHLPQVQTGRSPSPTSPSGGDAGNHAGRRGAFSLVNATVTPYHEHSTISVAAAESTMSCGGADVAMRAATAESAEIATERSRGAR